MPFVERTNVSLREEFARLAVQEGANVSELCRRYGISRKTGYKWIQRRSTEASADWPSDRSRRPKTSPKRTKPEIEEAVLKVRAEHPAWGGRKIRQVLLRDAAEVVPSASTVTAILGRHDRIASQASRAAAAFIRFERETPNQLWQMDFKGHFALSSGRCHPLTVLDDHSRFSLCLAACANEQTLTVKERLTEVFRRYGLPEAMIMDNGPPWGDGPGSPWTPLTVWLLQLGVRISHGRPYHPQTQGKDERFHRTFKAEVLAAQSFSDLARCQVRFDEWRNEYNTIRPHEALNLDVPANRYQISQRAFPDKLLPPEYADADVVRKVTQDGTFSFKGRILKLSKAFRGHSIALRPKDDKGSWTACFGAHKIKTFDLIQMTA
jgi:transposase InsO family protein